MVSLTIWSTNLHLKKQQYVLLKYHGPRECTTRRSCEESTVIQNSIVHKQTLSQTTDIFSKPHSQSPTIKYF